MNWLLLRGLAREQRHWGPFPDVFRARLQQDSAARVHCLDLPGTGTALARKSPASIRAIVEEMRERFLALRAAEAGPWSLLAISLGGMVAMQWCAAHPDDFSSLVLLNTSAANLSAPWRRMDFRVLPKIVRTLVMRDPVRRQRNILEMTTRLTADLDGLAVKFAGVQADAPIRNATVLRQLWAATRFRAPKRLALPVLVLAGGRDPFTDPSCPRRVATHFGAALEVHPEAGHDLPLDAPAWVAERVATWARR